MGADRGADQALTALEVHSSANPGAAEDTAAGSVWYILVRAKNVC